MAVDGEHTIAAEMNEEEISALHEVEVRNAKGKPETVAVEIKCRRIHVLPPIGKQRRYPALDPTVEADHQSARACPPLTAAR
ncbi:hypothetical protein NKH71_32875 [Mesorhizobium sp. M0983]|uniref:hypothetical protein n=1 Tax=Mesorhizobium sp. M0983 TaxID=2957040 RepID=UPI0033371B33